MQSATIKAQQPSKQTPGMNLENLEELKTSVTTMNKKMLKVFNVSKKTVSDKMNKQIEPL